MKLRTRILAAFAVVLIAFSLVFTGVNTSAFATEEKSMDTSGVLEDLRGFRINGKEVDLPGILDNVLKTSPEVLAFVEFKFSVVEDLKKNLGYYVYLFNPTGKAIAETGNDLHIRFGSEIDGNAAVRELPLTIVSVDDGTLSDGSFKDNAFYKFKVDTKSLENIDLYNLLDKEKRLYEVIEVDLNYGEEYQNVEVGLTYSYEGFVKGYAPEGFNDDNLSVSTNKISQTLHPTVSHTYFRPEETNGKNLYTQDSLHSVYFGIPNKYFEEYEKLNSLHASWTAARLAPFLVSGNDDFNTAIKPFIGKSIKANEKEYRSKVPYLVYGNYREPLDRSYTAAYSYGDLDHIFSANPFSAFNGGSFVFSREGTRFIDTLYMLHETSGKNSADKTLVTGYFLEYLIKYYSALYGGKSILGKYSKCLFDSFEDIDKRIFATDEFALTSEKFSDVWFNSIFYRTVSYKSFSTCNAVEEVNYDELAELKEKKDFEKLISKKYFVAERDVDNFVSTCEKNNAKGEKTYLFRYELTDYVASEVTFFKKGFLNMFGEDGTNGYFSQETVDLEFDIIDVEFTKEGQSYYIPCVMAPVDFFPDITPPVYTTEDGGCNSNWRSILGLILFIVLFALLFPFLKPILTIVIEIISVPFRLLAALFRNLRKSKPTAENTQKSAVKDKLKPKRKRK